MTSPVNPQFRTVKNINLFTGSGKTRKINPQKFDQFYQIKIDGVVFSGQAQINGKPILVKRKGKTLILSTPEDIDPLLEVSDFFMSASPADQLRELSTSELQSVIQAGSSPLDLQSHEGLAHASSGDVLDAAVQPKREGEVGWQLFVRGSDSAGLEKMNEDATDSLQIPGSWGWLAVAVAGGGGGGGGGGGASGGGTTPQAVLAINKVIGSITAGPLFNAADVRVEVYDKAGKFLGLAEVLPDGNFSYSWTSATAYTGELLFKAYSTLQDADDYRDEMGSTKDLPTLRAATYMTNGTARLYITPLTEYAVLKMGLAPDSVTPPAKDSLDAINMQVAKQFAIDPTNPNADVTKNEPVAAVNVDGTDNAQVNAYGKVLAVLSAVESAKGLSTTEVLAQINQREDSNNLDTLTQLTKKYLAAVDDSVSTKYKGFIVDLGLNLSFGTPTQHVVEAGGVHNATPGQPSATITFTMFDPAAGDVVSYDGNWLLGHGWSTSDSGLTYSKTGTYGTATLTLSTNTVSYLLNNLDPDTEALMQGQSVQDQFLVQITDQTGATAEFWANFDIDGASDGVAYIDHVTSNIAIANIGDDYLASANNGAITFTVHFSKQLANAATALDATGANFELVLSNGTKLTAGTDFFADVTLDPTDATNQTYKLAVFLMTPVDDAAVTLHYLAKPSGAAAAVRDVENVVTADHTAFANESLNTNAFKQIIDTAPPDAAVTLTDAGTDTILSGATQGVGLVNAAEQADTSAAFNVSHAADATQVDFFTADGLNWLATANVLNNWGITLNLSTLNANLDPNTGTGSYQFVTRQTDDAGNVVHSTYNLNFDTLAESTPVVSGITATVANADYTVKAGSEVFTISGSAQEEGTVTVVWDQGANGTAEFTRTYTVTAAEVGSPNAWSVDFSKSDLLSRGGAGQFTVTFTDKAGNTSTATNYSTTVDTGLVYNIAAGLGPALSTNDMVVSLYKADGTKLGDTTYNSATNKWSYTDITRYSGVVLAVLSDTGTNVADYRDEATNTNKDLANPLVSVFNVDGASNSPISANVTALTDLAAKKMGAAGVSISGATPGNNSSLTTAQIAQADAAVAKLFGIDISGTTLAAKAPSFTVDVSGADTSSSSDAYGLALAAISKAEQNASKTTADIVSDLAAALTISAAGVPTVSSSAPIKDTMATAISTVMAAASANVAFENNLQNGFVGSYDTTPPTLTISSTKSALKANGTATLTFTFSEAVKGFDASDISATLGTISNFAVTADPKIYTATFTAGAVEGDASVTVAAGAYTDLGGNSGGAGALPALSLAVDNTAPTLSGTTAPSYALTTVAGSAGNSVDETIVLTVTFSSVINGLTSGTNSSIFTVAGTGVSATWAGTDGTNTRTLTYKILAGQNGQAAIDEAALRTALLAANITDPAGNAFSYSGTIANIDATPLPVIDTTAPIITSGATKTVTDIAGAGIAAGATVYNAAISSTGTDVPSYSLSGDDAGLFNISGSGAVSFKAAETYAVTKDAGADHIYNFTVTATDAAGNAASKAVALTMGVDANTSASLFSDYAAAGYGDAISNAADVTFNANQNLALTTVANTSKDGLLSGSNALTQYIDRVTGTDIVSDAEFDAGFTITGKASANAANIKFYLDNDRTDGVDQIGTQLVSGTNGVTINYTASTGDYTISFAGGSAALKQATLGTAGSGVHKLTVDTNGNGLLDGAGTVNAEASRLFLVASGTAGTTSYDKNGGTVTNNTAGANFSVQDTITKNVFVYFYGDVDGSGVGMKTFYDNGDTVNSTSVKTDNRDGDAIYGDLDYYNSSTVTLGTPASVTNTAMGFVSNLSAKTYEFSAAQIGGAAANWSDTQTKVGNHVLTNSNTSRMMSAEELMALYAANFGGDTRTATELPLPGAVQAITSTSIVDAYVLAEDNSVNGWAASGDFWSSSYTAAGHLNLNSAYGYTMDSANGTAIYAAAVL